jgi:hypothetical protein
MLASTRQPGGDRRLPVAEDPLCGQRSQHYGDLVGGGFQTIQGSVASSTECAVTGRTSKGLDALGMPMLAISNEGVNMSIGVPVVGALLIGTGIASGVDPLGRSPSAFDLAPGTYRRMRRSYNRRVGAGEATGGAIVWGAGLEQTLHRGALGPCS